MQLAQCYAARRKRVGLERRIDKSLVPWLYSVGSLRHTEMLEKPVFQAEVSSVCKERLYFLLSCGETNRSGDNAIEKGFDIDPKEGDYTLWGPTGKIKSQPRCGGGGLLVSDTRLWGEITAGNDRLGCECGRGGPTCRQLLC